MINIVRLRHFIRSFIQIICELLPSKCLLNIDYARLFLKGFIFDYFVIYREAFHEHYLKLRRGSRGLKGTELLITTG